MNMPRQFRVLSDRSRTSSSTNKDDKTKSLGRIDKQSNSSNTKAMPKTDTRAPSSSTSKKESSSASTKAMPRSDASPSNRGPTQTMKVVDGKAVPTQAMKKNDSLGNAKPTKVMSSADKERERKEKERQREKEREREKVKEAERQKEKDRERGTAKNASVIEWKYERDRRYAAMIRNIDNLPLEEKIKVDEWAHRKLKDWGVCPGGFIWLRIVGWGYRCSGKAHFVRDAALERGVSLIDLISRCLKEDGFGEDVIKDAQAPFMNEMTVPEGGFPTGMMPGLAARNNRNRYIAKPSIDRAMANFTIRRDDPIIGTPAFEDAESVNPKYRISKGTAGWKKPFRGKDKGYNLMRGSASDEEGFNPYIDSGPGADRGESSRGTGGRNGGGRDIRR